MWWPSSGIYSNINVWYKLFKIRSFNLEWKVEIVNRIIYIHQGHGYLTKVPGKEAIYGIWVPSIWNSFDNDAGCSLLWSIRIQKFTRWGHTRDRCKWDISTIWSRIWWRILLVFKLLKISFLVFIWVCISMKLLIVMKSVILLHPVHHWYV